MTAGGQRSAKELLSAASSVATEVITALDNAHEHEAAIAKGPVGENAYVLSVFEQTREQVQSLQGMITNALTLLSSSSPPLGPQAAGDVVEGSAEDHPVITPVKKRVHFDDEVIAADAKRTRAALRPRRIAAVADDAWSNMGTEYGEVAEYLVQRHHNSSLGATAISRTPADSASGSSASTPSAGQQRPELSEILSSSALAADSVEWHGAGADEPLPVANGGGEPHAAPVRSSFRDLVLLRDDASGDAPRFIERCSLSDEDLSEDRAHELVRAASITPLEKQTLLGYLRTLVDARRTDFANLESVVSDDDEHVLFGQRCATLWGLFFFNCPRVVISTYYASLSRCFRTRYSRSAAIHTARMVALALVRLRDSGISVLFKALGQNSVVALVFSSLIGPLTELTDAALAVDRASTHPFALIFSGDTLRGGVASAVLQSLSLLTGKSRTSFSVSEETRLSSDEEGGLNFVLSLLDRGGSELADVFLHFQTSVSETLFTSHPRGFRVLEAQLSAATLARTSSDTAVCAHAVGAMILCVCQVGYRYTKGMDGVSLWCRERKYCPLALRSLDEVAVENFKQRNAFFKDVEANRLRDGRLYTAIRDFHLFVVKHVVLDTMAYIEERFGGSGGVFHEDTITQLSDSCRALESMGDMAGCRTVFSEACEVAVGRYRTAVGPVSIETVNVYPLISALLVLPRGPNLEAQASGACASATADGDAVNSVDDPSNASRDAAVVSMDVSASLGRTYLSATRFVEQELARILQFPPKVGCLRTYEVAVERFAVPWTALLVSLQKERTTDAEGSLQPLIVHPQRTASSVMGVAEVSAAFSSPMVCAAWCADLASLPPPHPDNPSTFFVDPVIFALTQLWMNTAKVLYAPPPICPIVEPPVNPYISKTPTPDAITNRELKSMLGRFQNFSQRMLRDNDTRTNWTHAKDFLFKGKKAE